nr:hypothetical protein [Gottschalkia purinilytica]
MKKSGTWILIVAIQLLSTISAACGQRLSRIGKIPLTQKQFMVSMNLTHKKAETQQLQ